MSGAPLMRVSRRVRRLGRTYRHPAQSVKTWIAGKHTAHEDKPSILRAVNNSQSRHEELVIVLMKRMESGDAT